MAILAAAQIDVNANGDEFVFNAIAVDENDYAYLQSIWKDFYPTQRIQWISELTAAPGYIPPVWIGWIKQPDGNWNDPN